ncbi:copper-binding protein [Maricaulis maris]|uniref:copper-binding protein n=1 Tax=Maricaulis maris TaxID=74318 RepID=UPI0030C75F63
MITLLTTSFLLATGAVDHHDHHGGDHHGAMASEMAAQSVTFGDVRTVDVEARTAIIRHGAMPEVGMGAMVMPFMIDEAVDISLFEPGAALTITVTSDEEGLHVIAAEPEADAG